jgi:hypothetical protein
MLNISAKHLTIELRFENDTIEPFDFYNDLLL